MNRPPVSRAPARQGGAALLLILLLVLSVVLGLFFRPAPEATADRPQRSLAALQEARAALIGEAAARANDGTLGLLQTPDLGSTRNTLTEEGRAAGNFNGNAQNLSVLGRLPWRTLGLRPLRDVGGECLWYAVSGSAQNAQPPVAFNWDSVGQFELFTSDGTAAGTRSLNADPHNRPLALIIAPGVPLAGQNRAAGADVVSECGGNYDAANYLDPATPDARLGNIVNYFPAPATNHATGDATASPLPFVAGPIDVVANNRRTPLVNDLVLPITATDIFAVAKQRSDFASNLNALINNLAAYLNTLATLPAATGSKGFDAVVATCLADPACPSTLRADSSTLTAFAQQWRDNFLYAGGPSGTYTVNGQSGCKAVLIFAGERTTVQQRASAAQKTDPAMYLEGSNAAQFPASGNYSGATGYDKTATSADIVRCITGQPPGAVQVSLAADYASLSPVGGSGAARITPPSASAGPSLAFAAATGITGGCAWFPTWIPLAGKTLRAYYEYQFASPDTKALTNTGADRGYGFTLQFVRGDIPNATGAFIPPNTCGRESNLGALATTDLWGSKSYIIETDIYRTSGRNDPTGNHIGILSNGSLTHPATPTSACDGTSTGCAPSPANVFEESPLPLVHTQRIEIHTGCNASCTQCAPSQAGNPGYSNARISTWLDCTACADVSRDFVGGEQISAAPNRDLTAPGDWQGSGWSFTTGSLAYAGDGASASLPNSALTTPPSAGKTYRVQLGLRTDEDGTLTISFGGRSIPLTLESGSGTFVLELDALGNSPLTLTPDGDWEGALTSASINTPNLPSARSCLSLPSEMNYVFFGLTGGFTSTAAEQGVTVRTLYLRSD